MTEQELAGLIWDVKETIRDTYDDTEVENVILPFTLLRRMDCILQPVRSTIEQELAKYDEPQRSTVLKTLIRKYGLQFYNTSGFTLSGLLAKPAAIGANFKLYLEGYTDNIKDILNNYTHEDAENGDLTKIYSRLLRENLLFQVTQQFANIDLSPKAVDNAKMGTIFEIIIRRAKESTNTKAGQFYTPRDIVRTLASLVLCGKEQEIQTPYRHFSIYDPCCGTGGMLTEAKKLIEEKAKEAGRTDVKVMLNGQELNEKTYAICKADMLLTGELQSGDIEVGDTLASDKFVGKTFNYMLANPPFGVDWKKIEKTITAEYDSKKGRFNAGLPSTTDGSLLFLQHMISKMDKDFGSRIGIVLNGSPLFNGDAGSGWSNIRKSLLEDDILDAIIAIPKNLFYSTDISTYLWILDNKKPESHKGKILFINASDQDTFSELLKKNLGKKRYSISDKATTGIVELYRNFTNAELTIGKETVTVARLMDIEDFLYTKVTVERPLLDENKKPILKKGMPQPDGNLRDTERIPFKTDIDTYFKNEVIRFAPDAWMDRTKDKIGCEFPFTKLFYRYKSPRATDVIFNDLKQLDKDIEKEISNLKNAE